jgi:polyisoprenoid-binding protein YceI
MRDSLSQRTPYYRYCLQTLLLTAGLVSISQAATYEVDPTHANVRFAIDHFKTSTNTGGFYNLTGQLQYDAQDKTGHIAIDIPMQSLNTGNEDFDKVLKSPDFFDAERYPSARFESTQWHFAKGTVYPQITRIDGNLTLHGQTHPVQLTAIKYNCYFSLILKKSVCGGDFTTTIDRTKWGINKYVLLGMSKQVTLNIQIEAAKQ